MRIPLLLAALLAAASSAHAQTVRGRLLDNAGRPVAGAQMSLVDTAGGRVARGLSAEDGGYSLRATVAGAYRVRAERIGHATAQSPVLTLAADQTTDYDLRSTDAAVVLRGITGRRRSRCTVRPGAGLAAATLWTEARKALDAVTWDGTTGYAFTFVEYENNIATGGMRVRSGEHRTTSRESRAVWSSPEPEALAREGFRRLRSGGVWYVAPDAGVLLSAPFQDSHCFSAIEGAGADSGLVGLAFEPQRAGGNVDVAGTLWIDEATAELRRLEYRYRGLPVAEDHPMVGGRVDFARLPNGAWIVKRWRIRMPLFQVEPQATRANWSRTPRMTAIREAGGHLARVADRRGATLLPGDGGVVAGIVTVGPGGPPLAGATVMLQGTQHRALSDSAGRFRIGDLAEGVYGLTFRHPMLDSLRISHRPVDVRVRVAATTRVELDGPTPDGALAAGCPDTTTAGIVVGTARNQASDAPLAGAEVRLRWAGDGSITATSDAEGRYRFCSAPIGVPLHLSAIFLAGDGDLPPFTLRDRRAARHDVRLRVVAQSVAVEGVELEATGNIPVRVTGTVYDMAGKPVAGVVVRFGKGLPERRTDRRGRFTVPSVPQGLYSVEFVDEEHGSQSHPVAVGGGVINIEVTLSPRPPAEQQ